MKDNTPDKLKISLKEPAFKRGDVVQRKGKKLIIIKQDVVNRCYPEYYVIYSVRPCNTYISKLWLRLLIKLNLI